MFYCPISITSSGQMLKNKKTTTGSKNYSVPRWNFRTSYFHHIFCSCELGNENLHKFMVAIGYKVGTKWFSHKLSVWNFSHRFSCYVSVLPGTLHSDICCYIKRLLKCWKLAPKRVWQLSGPLLIGSQFDILYASRLDFMRKSISNECFRKCLSIIY